MSAELLQKLEEQASRYLETNRIPDPYYFDFENGKIISPNTKLPIENYIITTTATEHLELEGFLKIQNETSKRGSGFAIWISPPDPYPVSKIIISEIIFQNNIKRLLNRAILTEWNETESILIAQRLFTLSYCGTSIKTANDVRKTPIFIEKSKSHELSEILNRTLNPKALKMISDGEDFSAKKRFMSEVLINKRLPALGKFSESCLTTPGSGAFSVFSQEKQILCCKCPFCDHEVMAEIYEGEIHCPNCKEKRPYKKAA